MSTNADKLNITNLATAVEIRNTRAILEERGFRRHRLDRLGPMTVEVGREDLGQRHFLEMKPWVMSLDEINSSGIMEFVWVPAGCFQPRHADPESHGDTNGESSNRNCRNGCWLGRYEVSNGEYWNFRPTHQNRDREGFPFNDADQPVVYISHDDALSFAGWVTKRSKG